MAVLSVYQSQIGQAHYNTAKPGASMPEQAEWVGKTLPAPQHVQKRLSHSMTHESRKSKRSEIIYDETILVWVAPHHQV
jgi:hypothetical protein